jgi:WhiB family transcriptional regulator, redox-sensing transcriptional regulator
VETALAHGRNGYRKGCRCTDCCEAARAYRKWIYDRTGDNRPISTTGVNRIVPAVGEGWRDNAACAGQPSYLFFDDEANKWKQAKELCATCPVLTQCRSWAMSYPAKDLYGFWAGLTQRERRNIQNRQKEAPTCPVPITLRTVGKLSGIISPQR